MTVTRSVNAYFSCILELITIDLLFGLQVLDVKDPPPMGRCFHTKAYLADVTGFGLVVYDSQLNTSWRVQNKYFYPNPYFGTHNIAGEQFELMDGLFGMALSPRQPHGIA